MNSVSEEIKIFSEFLLEKGYVRLALFLLEAHRPFFSIFSLIGVSFIPLISIIIPEKMKEIFLKITESRESLDTLTLYLEFLTNQEEASA